MKKLALLALTVAFVLGMSVSSAFALADGNYQLLIQVTPTTTAAVPSVGTFTVTQWGSNGNYNSSFSFGILPGAGSQAQIDGTSDGYAGVVGISVSSGSVSVTSFQKDDIPGTAGGTFSQYGTITGLGTVDGSGNFSLDPDGRLGGVSGFPLTNERWNYSDFFGQNAYDALTTGTATFTDTNGTKTIAGTPIYTDTNGDMWMSLVSGGYVGSDWGGFWGATYFEVWKVQIVPSAAVPEPGSLLLIGSGLVGLIGLARKRSKK